MSAVTTPHTPVTTSELSTFMTCEVLHHYRYTLRRDGFERPEPMARGTRIHAWLAGWWNRAAPFGPLQEPIERAMALGYEAFYASHPHNLKNVRTSVPFMTRIQGVPVVGELDAIGTNERGETVIVEHKTTTADISPGSVYWEERAVVDPQVTTYLSAFPHATVLYDVLRVPELEQYEATPVEKRKYTKPTKKDPVPRLYASQRAEPETDDEYVARILEDMAEKPESYFQRATLVRTEAELADYALDVREIEERIHLPLARVKNRRSCFGAGRGKRCDFYEACWRGADIESYPARERNHSEDVTDRLATYENVSRLNAAETTT
jgi:hypothetical protein